MSASSNQLFRVQFEVRLTPDHPMFFEAGDGLLSIWLFDQSAQEAGDRAGKIVSYLPYERATNAAAVISADKDTRADMRACAEQARKLGFELRFDCLTLETAIPDVG